MAPLSDKKSPEIIASVTMKKQLFPSMKSRNKRWIFTG